MIRSGRTCNVYKAASILVWGSFVLVVWLGHDICRESPADPGVSLA